MLTGDFPMLNQNSVFKVLKSLSEVPNNTASSTQSLRRIVQDNCLRNQQNNSNFDNNQQFDAADFLSSFLEHMLNDHSHLVNNLFGKNQETIFCMNFECNAAYQVPPNEVNIVVLPL